MMKISKEEIEKLSYTDFTVQIERKLMSDLLSGRLELDTYIRLSKTISNIGNALDHGLEINV